ncbi:hypothetical protein EZV62_003403 [Acer yangbiense]|uniref:DUF4220 domain-containing protein n=1 Tax=Acer yangbiense TaxID=1000413 RepID=A0A5C7IHA8_9ROSI|nr:hypothetical protein EZV62_003403 [Acer yangbiense]
MEIFPETLKRQWNLWEIRSLVLLSLSLQIILIMFGSWRKINNPQSLIRDHFKCNRLVCIYISADWVATVALSAMASNEAFCEQVSSKATDSLQAFWAPFLLLHLGGPDTAYSLEDNELWLRHFLGLINEVGVAFYVFVRFWSSNSLMFLSIPMFITGIVKYGERTWVLWSSNTKRFKNYLDSLISDYVRPPDLFNYEFPYNKLVVKEGINPNDHILVEAYYSYLGLGKLSCTSELCEFSEKYQYLTWEYVNISLQETIFKYLKERAMNCTKPDNLFYNHFRRHAINYCPVERISEVWLEMLAYVAQNCEWGRAAHSCRRSYGKSCQQNEFILSNMGMSGAGALVWPTHSRLPSFLDNSIAAVHICHRHRHSHPTVVVGAQQRKCQSLEEHYQRQATKYWNDFYKRHNNKVDALTTKRGKEGGWVVERLLNQLLIELDGADQRRGVFVIGATNRPDVMDRAVLRPGRFGKLLYVPLPTVDERRLILKALSRKKPIDANVDLCAVKQLKACKSLSGADLSALMNEAAMAAWEEKLTATKSCPLTIKIAHFERAPSKITPSVSNQQRQRYQNLSESLKAA